MIILADQREQKPWSFPAEYPVEMATLISGDYSIRGLDHLVALERKEPGDLLACLSWERERFERELHRLRGFRLAAVIVEMSWADLVGGNYRSKMTPQAAVASVAAFMVRYRVPILFADDRAGAQRLALELLKGFHRELTKIARILDEELPGTNQTRGESDA